MRLNTPLEALQALSDESSGIGSVDGVDWQAVDSCVETLAAVHAHLDVDLINTIEDIDVSFLNVSLADYYPSETVNRLDQRTANLPERSVLQEIWDELRTLSENYRTWHEASRDADRYATLERELGVAKDAYLAARDDVLGDTFDRISDQFAAFYSGINPDEATFGSELNQTNTGVKFSVGFHNEGCHPPNALHSEGHQDLMGVALFLTLVAEFSPLERTPVLLDDVFMSVDSTHRARIAERLANQFSDQFQFVVATHDQRWAEQLEEAGLVDAENVIGIDDWTLSDGPQIRR